MTELTVLSFRRIVLGLSMPMRESTTSTPCSLNSPIIKLIFKSGFSLRNTLFVMLYRFSSTASSSYPGYLTTQKRRLTVAVAIM